MRSRRRSKSPSAAVDEIADQRSADASHAASLQVDSCSCPKGDSAARKRQNPPKVTSAASQPVNAPQGCRSCSRLRMPAVIRCGLDDMPPPPDNFPDGWDMEWQPSFDEAAIASKPEPKFKKNEADHAAVDHARCHSVGKCRRDWNKPKNAAKRFFNPCMCRW